MQRIRQKRGMMKRLKDSIKQKKLKPGVPKKGQLFVKNTNKLLTPTLQLFNKYMRNKS